MSRYAIAEGLESRRLLSGVELVEGVLTVTGTEANDTVVVEINSVKQTVEIVLNGKRTFHPAASVVSVKAMLGTGNDLFDATKVSLRAHVDGEGGNDTLRGGAGDDCLIGGLDNDLVAGNIGADSVYGNGGKDNLDGGPGRDRVDGGKTNDIVRGGSSNDRLIGGDGCDLIYGDGGDDLFYCEGIYADSLFGGTGCDRAYVDGDDILASIEIRL
jgi:Ca2+-binding RTX toxin-like protein